jgi:hypothetical protein
MSFYFELNWADFAVSLFSTLLLGGALLFIERGLARKDIKKLKREQEEKDTFHAANELKESQAISKYMVNVFDSFVESSKSLAETHYELFMTMFRTGSNLLYSYSMGVNGSLFYYLERGAFYKVYFYIWEYDRESTKSYTFNPLAICLLAGSVGNVYKIGDKNYWDVVDETCLRYIDSWISDREAKGRLIDYKEEGGNYIPNGGIK